MPETPTRPAWDTLSVPERLARHHLDPDTPRSWLEHREGGPALAAAIWGLDEKDRNLRAERIGARARLIAAAPDRPLVGDFARFADGTLRRISHVWQWDDDPIELIQTSTDGSWHLCESGHISMSGSLFGGLKPDLFSLSGNWETGDVWFFHHNWWKAHNAVHTRLQFRVFTVAADPN